MSDTTARRQTLQQKGLKLQQEIACCSVLFSALYWFLLITLQQLQQKRYKVKKGSLGGTIDNIRYSMSAYSLKTLQESFFAVVAVVTK